MTDQATQQHEASASTPPSSDHLAEPRTAHVRRSTNESTVEVELNLDGSGESQISTGVRFYDHMLASLARHSLIDL
ncbi:MAG: hypothetical protein ABI934_09525, partial [Actinomycetota bacterium]